jgi:hypothetical protein
VECSIRVTALPEPGDFPRVVIFIIFILVVAGAVIRAGYTSPPDVTMAVTTAGLAAARVTRAMFPASPARGELR